MESLYIIIPAYNEEETIETVAREWHEVVRQIGIESKLVIIDDGSKDSTYQKLRDLSEALPQLVPITKSNSGHGATLLYGYKYALEHNADYVFQTDSDGQTVPAEFAPFWESRRDYAAQIGNRKHREDGLSRVLVTKILKLVLFLCFHLIIPDANTPYRLMSRDLLTKYIPAIPDGYNLTNVMLAVYMAYNKENVRYLPISFLPRQGGTNSINLMKISAIGWQAVKDFRRISMNLKHMA